jgi:phosphoglycerol transferase MdoB-like AlkP superfamily enzyme
LAGSVSGINAAEQAALTRSQRIKQFRREAWFASTVASLIATLVLAAVLVFTIELISRDSLDSTILFLRDWAKPGWVTIILFALVMIAIDAMLGRAHLGFLVVAPPTLTLAFICEQKAHYLGDPLYPTDFLYSDQIIELMPLLVRDRPFLAIMMGAAAVVAVVVLLVSWVFWCRSWPGLSRLDRVLRLAIAVPVLAFFASLMDYGSFSWIRDRLQVVPIMWDQKENYAHNGFTLAFAFNLPMANVTAPVGFSDNAVSAIETPQAAVAMPWRRPDIIVVMSESFWDPGRLPGVKITPDPIAYTRKMQSGHIFSPEFGGMTANVEFEALTGFSNAFLPYGSIPYQQYVRDKIPSLATFLSSEGYETLAVHPFSDWFWNRKLVYDAFGFDRFLSEENLPPLKKRGPLASDEALTEEIINRAESAAAPLFLFAVTLQGHGPYEPNRYSNVAHRVEARVSKPTRDQILTYAEGVADADRGLKRLIDWAKRRTRPTIIAFFGDHLPPIGPAYVETGYMKEPVASRKGSLAEMSAQHDTPLVIWSNRKGRIKDVGAISPAFLPFHVLKAAGIKHPYYTGFLGEIRERYRVVDRTMLVTPSDQEFQDWSRKPEVDPVIRDFRFLQYDMMFGKRRAVPSFFPEMDTRRQWVG